MRLEEILPPLKKQIVFWRVLVLLLPWRVLGALRRVPSHGGHEEAVLLFTSGSAGEPKGVVLSHRNILSNVSQFSSMLDFTGEDSVLGCLPFFHSFGCTVTLWYPIIEGIRLITYPNPLEIAKNAELIARHGITLFLSTPTFLRGYLRKTEPSQFDSLKLIVTGAEKLPDELARAFEERFGKTVLQGYGSPRRLLRSASISLSPKIEGERSGPALHPGRLGRENGRRHGRADPRSRFRPGSVAA